ncbi:MAG: hypothetical protein R8F63_18965 [Acidimicrobiales bacterium]|nr:hypothetical protein [Acidimicrobiales bacterium]
MELERQQNTPSQRGLSMPARLVIGGLALFGAISLVQWVLTSLIGIVKFGLMIVIVVGVVGWVLSAKGRR